MVNILNLINRISYRTGKLEKPHPPLREESKAKQREWWGKGAFENGDIAYDRVRFEEYPERVDHNMKALKNAVTTLTDFVTRGNITYHKNLNNCSGIPNKEEKELLYISFSNDVKEIKPVLDIFKDMHINFGLVEQNGTPTNTFRIKIAHLIERVGVSNFAKIIEDADNRELVEVKNVKSAIREKSMANSYERD